MNGTVRATQYGYSLWEFQVFGTFGGGTPGRLRPANAALGRPATASSTENAGTPAGRGGRRQRHAPAGRPRSAIHSGSRSTSAPPRASARSCCSGRQRSPARSRSRSRPAATGPFTTIFATTTGTGGTQTLAVSGSGRYVRMNGTARATAFGYSLFEFQVRGRRRDDPAADRHRDAAVVRQAGDRVLGPERRPVLELRAGQGARRRPGDPVGDRGLGRPGLDRRRPRRHRARHQGRAAVGPGVRDRVPDPGLAGRRQLDDDLLDHHRPGLQGDADRRRHRPVRADVRHRQGDDVRLLAVGVPGVRHRRQPGRAAGPAAERDLPGHPDGLRRRVQRPGRHRAVAGPLDRGDRHRAEQRAGVLHAQPERLDRRRRQPGDRGAPGDHGGLELPRRPVPVHVRPDQHPGKFSFTVRARRGADQGVRDAGPVAGVLAAGRQLPDRRLARVAARSTSWSTSAGAEPGVLDHSRTRVQRRRRDRLAVLDHRRLRRRASTRTGWTGTPRT